MGKVEEKDKRKGVNLVHFFFQSLLTSANETITITLVSSNTTGLGGNKYVFKPSCCVML